MIVDIIPGCDLSRLITGRRVRILRDLPGYGRDIRYGVFESLRHNDRGSAGGMLAEEPHPGCKGGMTGFDLPYGSRVATVATSIPELHGVLRPDYDGRYRLWTAAHGVDFDDLPAYDDGGPAMVALDGWSKSTETICRVLSSPSVVAADDGKVTLHVRRITTDFGAAPHPLEGTRYDSRRDADRAAYEAGITGFMVYEKNAHHYEALNV